MTSTPPNSSSDPDRIERKYHPNGQLAEEITYLRNKLHGRCRKWHANGQLYVEQWFESGLNTTGTSRAWYPNGQVLHEIEWEDGQQTRVRSFDDDGHLLFDSQTSDTKLLRKIFTRAQRAKPTRRKKVSPADLAKHDAFINQLLNSRSASASAWLSESADFSRNLGELSLENSKLLIEHLISLGALDVLAVEIEDVYATNDQTANHALVKLSEDPESRGRVFSYINAYARNQGFDKDPDFGQQWLYLKVK